MFTWYLRSSVKSGIMYMALSFSMNNMSCQTDPGSQHLAYAVCTLVDMAMDSLEAELVTANSYYIVRRKEPINYTHWQSF